MIETDTEGNAIHVEPDRRSISWDYRFAVDDRLRHWRDDGTIEDAAPAFVVRSDVVIDCSPDLDERCDDNWFVFRESDFIVVADAHLVRADVHGWD